MVAIAAPPLAPTPDAILTALGQLHAVLPHGRGCTWPNRAGQLLAAEALGAGGGVLLCFANLADALVCHQRLLKASA